jgi:hypothetical protein
VAYDESPWGHDMPPGYPYAVGKGQYGTYRAVPPANRRNPLALENGWDREPSAAEIAKHGYVKAKIRANKDTAPASSRKPRKGKKGGRKTQRAKEVADYSTEVKFTKQGQPYIILASGQPKFISREGPLREQQAEVQQQAPEVQPPSSLVDEGVGVALQPLNPLVPLDLPGVYWVGSVPGQEKTPLTFGEGQSVLPRDVEVDPCDVASDSRGGFHHVVVGADLEVARSVRMMLPVEQSHRKVTSVPVDLPDSRDEIV